MGKWLATCNVPFRCIAYTPFELSSRRFLSFSVAFDDSPLTIYPLSFQQRPREPKYFWHNIGSNSDDWWAYLIKAGQISANFENQPGDEGEQLLRSYISGDTIIAYAKKYGAVGWGKLEDPQSYKLIPVNDVEDKLDGRHRHRISIVWKAFSTNLKNGVSPDMICKDFGIYHPISTKVTIEESQAKRLIDHLSKVFKQHRK